MSTPSGIITLKISEWSKITKITIIHRGCVAAWKSTLRQKYRTFLAHSSTFRRWVLSRGDTRGDAWWRKLERLTQIAQ